MQSSIHGTQTDGGKTLSFKLPGQADAMISFTNDHDIHAINAMLAPYGMIAFMATRKVAVTLQHSFGDEVWVRFWTDDTQPQAHHKSLLLLAGNALVTTKNVGGGRANPTITLRVKPTDGKLVAAKLAQTPQIWTFGEVYEHLLLLGFDPETVVSLIYAAGPLAKKIVANSLKLIESECGWDQGKLIRDIRGMVAAYREGGLAEAGTYILETAKWHVGVDETLPLYLDVFEILMELERLPGQYAWAGQEPEAADLPTAIEA